MFSRDSAARKTAKPNIIPKVRRSIVRLVFRVDSMPHVLLRYSKCQKYAASMLATSRSRKLSSAYGKVSGGIYALGNERSRKYQTDGKFKHSRTDRTVENPGHRYHGNFEIPVQFCRESIKFCFEP